MTPTATRSVFTPSVWLVAGLFACSPDARPAGAHGAGGAPAAGSGGARTSGGEAHTSGGSASGGSAAGGRSGDGTGGASAGGTPGAGGATAEGGIPTGGGGAGVIDAGKDADSGVARCEAGVNGIEVADVDLDAFPPYAMDGCTLVYVNRSGELKRRDLATGAEVELAAADEQPRRPALAGGVTAWEATESGHSVVRVRLLDATTTVAGVFDHAGEPKATGDAVVFTGWLTPAEDGDTDVFVWDVIAASARLVLGGAGQQRFADISPDYVAVSDFSEDPGGRYTGTGSSLADVVVVDRATGAQVRRQLPGKQAFPMLGSRGSLAYLDWTEVHPVPKFQDYTIRAVSLATLAGTAREIAHVQSNDAVRPTVANGRAEWVTRGSTSSLFQADFAEGSVPVQVDLPGVSTVHAPISTARLTVLAVRPTQNAVPRLSSVAW